MGAQSIRICLQETNEEIRHLPTEEAAVCRSKLGEPHSLNCVCCDEPLRNRVVQGRGEARGRYRGIVPPVYDLVPRHAPRPAPYGGVVTVRHLSSKEKESLGGSERHPRFEQLPCFRRN
jgi:hypothetical protein